MVNFQFGYGGLHYALLSSSCIAIFFAYYITLFLPSANIFYGQIKNTYLEMKMCT